MGGEHVACELGLLERLPVDEQRLRVGLLEVLTTLAIIPSIFGSML